MEVALLIKKDEFSFGFQIPSKPRKRGSMMLGSAKMAQRGCASKIQQEASRTHMTKTQHVAQGTMYGSSITISNLSR